MVQVVNFGSMEPLLWALNTRLHRDLAIDLDFQRLSVGRNVVPQHIYWRVDFLDSVAIGCAKSRMTPSAVDRDVRCPNCAEDWRLVC